MRTASQTRTYSVSRAAMKHQRLKTMWDTIEDSPGELVAMKVRAQLFRAAQQKISASGM